MTSGDRKFGGQATGFEENGQSLFKKWPLGCTLRVLGTSLGFWQERFRSSPSLNGIFDSWEDDFIISTAHEGFRKRLGMGIDEMQGQIQANEPKW
jgi:hypothetical protein